jgi:hypothetical protein
MRTFFEVIEVTTHFVEDVAEMSTRCGLTSLKDRHTDDTSLDINDCTCPRCLRLVIGDLNKRLQVTHFVEDVAEMATICGLTSLKDKPNENTSLDINDCTCLQCLSLIIGNLTKRLQNINRSNVVQVQSLVKIRNNESSL